MRILKASVILALLLGAGLAGAAEIDGRILDDASKPVADSYLYVYAAAPKVGFSSLCPTCYRDCGKRVAADPHGKFHLSGLDPELRFDLLAVADGYEPSFLREVDPNDGPVSLKLRERSTEHWDRVISGFVEGPDGKPVIGAVVEPRGFRSSRFSGAAGYGTFPGLEMVSITNSRGEFQLRMPEADAKLDVRVTAPGMASYIERMLEPGKPKRVCMTEGVPLVGRVVKNGKAVPGIRIAVSQEDRESSGYLGSFMVATDEDGRFVLTDLAPNQTWVVGAPMMDLNSGVVDPVVVHTGELGKSCNAGTLEVRRGRRLSGSIVVPEGLVADADVALYVTRWPSGDLRNATISSDGSFTFDEIPNGIVWLEARAEGVQTSPESSHFNQIWQTIVLPREGDLSNVRVVLEPAVE